MIPSTAKPTNIPLPDESIDAVTIAQVGASF